MVPDGLHYRTHGEPAGSRHSARAEARFEQTAERQQGEARLTRTGPDGDVSMGLAGSWAAGAVLVDGDEPARFDQVTTGRAAGVAAWYSALDGDPSPPRALG